MNMSRIEHRLTVDIPHALFSNRESGLLDALNIATLVEDDLLEMAEDKPSIGSSASQIAQDVHALRREIANAIGGKQVADVQHLVSLCNNAMKPALPWLAQERNWITSLDDEDLNELH